MKPAFSQHPMAIDINLMPRQQASRRLPMLPVLLLTVAVVASAGLGWLWYDAQQKYDDAKSQLAAITAQTSELEARAGAQATGGSTAGLLQQEQLIRQSKTPASGIMAQLTELVPHYANVTSLSMDDAAKLSLTIQFGSTEALIGFRQAVEHSEHFALVGMSSIASTDTAAPAKIDVPAKPGSVTLPVYQTTFDLQYVTDKQGGK